MLLTPEGYEALKGELDTLRGDRRREIAERIRTAREFGDIAENAEYDDAKNERPCSSTRSRSSRNGSPTRA